MQHILDTLRIAAKEVEFGEIAFEQGYRMPRKYRHWREDAIQECNLALAENKPQDEQLAKTICWRRQRDFWRWLNGWRPKDAPRWQSLERVIGKDDDAMLEDVLGVEDAGFEELERQLDARALLKRIPLEILRIAAKRARGKALTSKERVKLHRFRKDNPELVQLYNEL